MEYITVFDALATTLPALNRLPRWRSIPTSTRAPLLGVFIVLVTLVLGSVSLFAGYPHIPLILLGVFYGAVASKLLSQFLAPKIQSVVTGFVGGLTVGNIGSREAVLRSWIRAIGDAVKDLVASLNPRTTQRAAEFDDAIVWCVWVAIATALLILAANAYYANVDSSHVGRPLQPDNPNVNAAAAGAGGAVPPGGPAAGGR